MNIQQSTENAFICSVSIIWAVKSLRITLQSTKNHLFAFIYVIYIIILHFGGGVNSPIYSLNLYFTLIMSLQVFLPGLLPHPDAVGVGVAGRGTRRHGAVASGVGGYCAGIGQVSWLGLGAGFFSDGGHDYIWQSCSSLLMKSHTDVIQASDIEMSLCLSFSVQLYLPPAILQWLPAVFHHPRQRV